MQVAPDTAAELRRILLGDAARLVVAIVSMAIGLGSILVQWMRRKTQDRVRLWFGLLAVLYGYRALLMTESARFFLTGRTIEFQIALITFTIGIPAILFGWGLVAKKHNWVTKSLLAVNALMAATFLLFYWNGERGPRALCRQQRAGDRLHTGDDRVLVRGSRQREYLKLRTLRIVILVWGSFVIYNNLRQWLPTGRRRLRVRRLCHLLMFAGIPGRTA